MTRADVLERLAATWDDGSFLSDLARRVAIPTESQRPDRAGEIRQYLDVEMRSTFEALGCTVELLEERSDDGTPRPFLVARRHEGADRPTVLMYGHADVVLGHEGRWADDRDPWTLDVAGDRVYGRGTADNKGQHSVNIAALDAVLAERGRLGFNLIFLIEAGEEVGSPGLHALVRHHRQLFAADVLIASDGPRWAPERPTLFLGARGALNLELDVALRDGAHHSGNWGGLLANPGVVLANAISSIIDGQGRVRVPALLPAAVPDSVRRALVECPIVSSDPVIDPDWGEPGLTPTERVIAWNTFEVLAFRTGDPDRPVGAIPPSAIAHCQIRYTADTDPATFVPALRAHLDEHGFTAVDVRTAANTPTWAATRLDPDDAWVRWAAASVERTTGVAPAILPNLGGSLPNDAFALELGLPTVWIPHSYAACSQHAPDEHALVPILREGLAIMGGLLWDLGDGRTPNSSPIEGA